MELICFLRGSLNHGQACIAGSRIFVQSGIYDKFLAKLAESAKAIKMGDPFAPDTAQGPLVSKVQFDVRRSSDCCIQPHLMARDSAL